MPEQYVTTPEGVLLKCAIKGSNSSNNPTKILKKYSRKYWIKKYQLPTKGKIRYVPPKNFHLSEGLPCKSLANGDVGFVDRFENVWVISESRTKGEPFE